MQLIIKKDPMALARATADWLSGYVRDVLKRQERFTVALSGGSTPELLYRRLADAPYREQLDWSRLHLFWGDERYVPTTDARSNARMARETLLSRVPVPAAQVHVMRTDLPPDESMQAYETLLHTYFDGHPTTFDLVLLGLGDDGHTLSLFPGTPTVHEPQRWTAAYYLESQQMHRLTLTPNVVNQAACVLFLVAGAAKANALRAVLRDDYQPDRYPAQAIRPASRELYWFVDEEAARAL